MLTQKQHQTYEFIKDYTARHGYAPTEAEIALGIGITSRGVVHRYVTALADAGLLRIIPHRRRNIELLNEQEIQAPSFRLPILSKIAAGQPLEALHSDRFLNLENLFGPQRFILEISGDSMTGDNICDGDYVICEKRTQLRKDDIAVVLIDHQEATLKRVESGNDGTITLIASNPTHRPQRYAQERVLIQGVYMGLLRFTQPL